LKTEIPIVKPRRINLGFGLAIWLVALLSWQWARERSDAGTRVEESGPVVAPGIRRLAESCAACHDLRGRSNRLGPYLSGILGRKAASVPGYPYSQAMRGSGLVWTRETLRKYLLDPLGTVPGTAMGMSGVPEDEVDALIRYLAAER